MPKLQLTSGTLLLASRLAGNARVSDFDRCNAKALVARGLAMFSDDSAELYGVGQTRRLLAGELAFTLMLASTTTALNRAALELANALQAKGGWTLTVRTSKDYDSVAAATQVYERPATGFEGPVDVKPEDIPR